jgi:uncharacterized protein
MPNDELQQPTPRYANTGYGPQFSVLDIGLDDKVAVVEPNTAFWALVEKNSLNEALSGSLVEDFQNQAEGFKEEMKHLRFGLKPSAAYFNPTERCNFNCSYCYLPEDMRQNGKDMTETELCDALARLSDYFKSTITDETKPQIIFHGSEPMMAREPMFAGIEKFADKFHFGVQTNATLLDDEAISFLKSHNVGIGVSLDAPVAEIANNTRKNWNGKGAFESVVRVIDKLADYPAFNVITTVTSVNVETLPQMVDFYHDHGVKVAMFNPVRCTQKGGQQIKPDNDKMAKYFCAALDRAYELYEKTGQKLVVANFANVLAAVAGPTGRRLMCDISPCGGGRCFFAVSAKGDVFPCSEFIGFPEFKGGNLYKDKIDNILETQPFKDITTRKTEDIKPCDNCAIRHFCGAPCPAEVKMFYGALNAPAPYCEFYEEQVRYAFRVIASGRENVYMWDGWNEETEVTFNFTL